MRIMGILCHGTYISIRAVYPNNTAMKTDSQLSSKKKQNNHNAKIGERKRKNYYERFLELMTRKTDSEKRMEVFGYDPFK